MWEKILKILDWLGSIIRKYLEQVKKNEEAANAEIKQTQEEIKHEYEKQKEEIPASDDGAAMVDYWRNRGK